MTNINTEIHGVQLNMAVLFWYLVKVTCPVYDTAHVYAGQVTFYKVPETHGHV